MTAPSLLPKDHRGPLVFIAIRRNLLLLFGLVAIAWGLEIIDFIFFGIFDSFGIRPRTWIGLRGIAFAPFLHHGFGHLISNTVPFIVLGGIVLIGGRKLFLRATAVILLLSGVGLWIFGPANTNHIGASSLIFGYLGFLLMRGFMERSSFWSFVALVILVLYGGMIGGILPGERGVSWQGHLFGFLAGILAARIFFTRGAGIVGSDGTSTALRG